MVPQPHVGESFRKTLNSPMHIYPATAVIRAQRGGILLILKILRGENGLLEVNDRPCVATHREWERTAPSKSLIAAKRNTRDVIEFHHPLERPSKNITLGTTRAAGVRLARTFIPCMQCSDARMRRHAVPKVLETVSAAVQEDRLFVEPYWPIP